MSAKVERLVREIEGLTAEETRELFQRIADRLELAGWLKLCESAFADWDNEEDAVYDTT